jgi:UDP-N-acetylmuramoylalanine--D-glutamate ligase
MIDVTPPPAAVPHLGRPLIVGFGVTGQALAKALVKRGIIPTIVEDRPGPSTTERAAALGVDLIATPTASELADAIEESSALLPSPGVPDHHAAFALAADRAIPTLSEFDLAGYWDDRPILAITGTNGKTTVTTMVTEALRQSGLRAEAVGNTDVPLVTAIDDSTTEVFVVEASSFRLGHSQVFSPQVGAWLNFAPDHLDAHASLEAYEQSKASIWDHLPAGSVAVANADDPVVMRHLARLDETRTVVQRFSLTQPVEWRLETSVDAATGTAASSLVDGTLHGPDGPLIDVSELARRQPHDVANALAAAAIAIAGGATAEGVAEMLRDFNGLPHRLQLVGTVDGVSWFNDSKATVPQATAVAVSGFDSVVLIAGGRNKGLSMDTLESTVPPVRAVVATGDATDEIAGVYEPHVPVKRARSMDEAVDLANTLAEPGDVVMLSPACTSFDWYPNYGERGRHFVELVNQKILQPSGQKVMGE